MDIEAFGQRLKELRNGKSQTDIVKMILEKTGLSITAQTYGRYENGKRKPDIEIIEALANTFDVSADYLLCKSDIKTTNTGLKAICEYTGLSEEAVLKLNDLKNTLNYSSTPDYLSNLINEKGFADLVVKIDTIKQNKKTLEIFKSIRSALDEITLNSDYSHSVKAEIIEMITKAFGFYIDTDDYIDASELVRIISDRIEVAEYQCYRSFMNIISEMTNIQDDNIQEFTKISNQKIFDAVIPMKSFNEDHYDDYISCIEKIKAEIEKATSSEK